MSDTRTGGTKLALVLGAIIFVVSFILLLWICDYRFLPAFFLALLLAFLSAIVLYLAFGDGEWWSGRSGTSTSTKSGSVGPVAGAATAAAAGAASAASASSSDADAKAAETAKREADARAAVKAAEDAAARDAAAQAERKAAEDAAARDAAAEADRKAAEDRAAEERRAEAARAAADIEKAEAARAEAANAAPATASANMGEDYDGDGVLEGANEGTRPAGLDGPRCGAADDLKMIKGVGKKMEELVNSLGFWHFDQLADWTDDEVAWVDANLKGFKGRVSRDKWVEQAKLLAAGGETEFSKRVEGGDVY